MSSRSASNPSASLLSVVPRPNPPPSGPCFCPATVTKDCGTRGKAYLHGVATARISLGCEEENKGLVCHSQDSMPQSERPRHRSSQWTSVTGNSRPGETRNREVDWEDRCSGTIRRRRLVGLVLWMGPRPLCCLPRGGPPHGFLRSNESKDSSEFALLLSREACATCARLASCQCSAR